MTPNIFKVSITLFASLAITPCLSAALWFAQPIIVHEWGVNTYDWSGKSQAMPTFPDFIYTDQKPRKMTANKNIVKHLPPDSGIRYKPLLYFYPPAKTPVKVGVEVRFAFGHANAWYPQVDVYRTPDQVKHAKPPVVADNKLQSIPGQSTPAPDDERFELVWNEITLNSDNDNKIRTDLPESHWIHEARKVDAATVSNGTGGEAEKFVFYEGINSEGPKICIVPTKDGYSIINTGDYTIYDLTCVYRRDGVRYNMRIDELAPMPQGNLQSGKGAAVLPAMNIPSLDKIEVDALSPEELKKADQIILQKEMNNLVSALTKGSSLLPQYVMMRNPAHPQPATTMHTLYQKEAEGLAKIWREDFFEQEGLTIIYRESPAYLDMAMPLNIYTDMYHYIQLNRCGLVCNNHIPLEKLDEIQQASLRLLNTDKPDPKDLKLCMDKLLLTKSFLNHFKKQGYDAKRINDLSAKLSQ